MAELTAQERLQPSLLDRLVDSAPGEQVEGDDKKVLTKQALRQAVLRDLGWLFNATGHSPVPTIFRMMARTSSRGSAFR